MPTRVASTESIDELLPYGLTILADGVDPVIE